MPTRRCARSRRRSRATAALRAATCICWSSIRPTSRPATNRSRAARPKPSSRRASARPIASPSSGFPGPDRRWGSPRIARARWPSSRRCTADLERHVSRARAATSRSTRRMRSPAATTRSSPTCMTRQSVDLTADVGAAASAGMAGVVDRARRAMQDGRPGDRSRQVILENARTVVAQADADGARFAAAAGRSHRAVPHRRGAKDGHPVFRGLSSAAMSRASWSRSPPPPPRATRCSTPST